MEFENEMGFLFVEKSETECLNLGWSERKAEAKRPSLKM